MPMSLDFVTLDHNCNVVRREIEEEFRNLSLLFIPHLKGERHKTFIDKRSFIQSKPHGRKIYDIISLNSILERDNSEFMGLIINNAHKLNILGRKNYTAVFFINASDFMFQDNSKQPIYHMVWHALLLYMRVSKFGGNGKANTDNNSGKIIKPRYNELKQAKNNLMADIFSAIMMEIEGNTRYIESLAQKRSNDSLSRIHGFLPENYPYPLTYEACRLLYDDIKSSIHEKKHLTQQVLDLTQEVAFIFDENSLLQWWEFSRSAQEMAWQDHTPEEILGNAIYTSDNTDVRALAYQLAELLETSPSSQTAGQGEYNPFAPEAVSRRLRDSQCEDTFGRLISIATLQSDPQIFYAEAEKQNNALLGGKVLAWCAPALEAAARCLEQEFKNPINFESFAGQHPSEKASQVFYNAQKSLSPEVLKELALCILTLRRLNETADIGTLCHALSKREDLAAIQHYLCANLADATISADDPDVETAIPA